MNIFYANREYTFPDGELPERLLQVWDTVVNFGDVVDSRLGRTLEVLGASFTLYNEDIECLERFVRDHAADVTRPPFNNSIINQEHIAVLAGRVGPISQAFGSTGSTKYSTVIGNRKVLMDKLSDGSRQALLTVGDDTCWTSVQLFNRGGRLSAVLNARSVDAYNGLIPDALFWHRYLIKDISVRLGLPFIGMVLNIGSLHLYRKDGRNIRPLIGLPSEDDNS